MTPNMIVVKIDNSLVQFPISSDGTLFNGESFQSDYDINEYQVVLASFDCISYSSIELRRYTIFDKAGIYEEKLSEVIKNVESFQEIVKELVKEYNESYRVA